MDEGSSNANFNARVSEIQVASSLNAGFLNQAEARKGNERGLRVKAAKI